MAACSGVVILESAAEQHNADTGYDLFADFSRNEDLCDQKVVVCVGGRGP